MVQAFDVLDMLLAEKPLRGHHCRNFAMKIEDHFENRGNRGTMHRRLLVTFAVE